ncbi:ORC-CDC6 family AAA ATPase [Phaeobacter gallaeciensis]|uniref:Uncharacterized protein n=1 Tax=Phaeobacter gallaeciensis TaxID=60890 RepID=A0AAC9Z5A1_9RHOB|nr:hypothetical protein [Phaeobacter gallaeciensis]AHD07946.1 hypothetical protein Gal_00145 [Phaeobacter gallaeciensis DSM 26640]ATE91214.1 hypothetical protein PhaeoP11_00144 [Phaeobacter gallaeciensis]ATE95489.1 hypothetical protein PhaeoP73_00144 [Phaeobacter gallaeciensis]ATE99828.1 hypothetical protein PhaeoP75_00144 [Phaeobacter gallaeciensis]ATF04261.1 hypothetical protein PhaeoP63_00144 [Phaeobacter gallaeciensis]
MTIDQGRYDTFNAKHRTPQEVASTFVNPSTKLNRLCGHFHSVLTGPRGSGKTTLLKMLTMPALASWKGEKARDFKSNVDFVSVFIPADRSWHGQIKELSRQVPSQAAAEALGNATFTTHIFRAIAKAFADWQSEAVCQDEFLASLTPKLSFEQEQEVVKGLAEDWMLKPAALTFYELREALSKRLSVIGYLKNKASYVGERIFEESDNSFLYLNYREGMRRAHDLHNHHSNLPGRRWLFLFDELEVAPSTIQKNLFFDLRGANDDDTQIYYKLALAPYNHYFVRSDPDTDASVNNDYRRVDLTFPQKLQAVEFASDLCESLVKSAGLQGDLRSIFDSSDFTFEDSLDETGGKRARSKYSSDSELGKVFIELSQKDRSFETYLQRKKIDFNRIEEMSENDLASSLRKARNIVIARNFFTRPVRNGFAADKLSSRSRKTYSLYAGMPSLLTLTEGNPRALINLISPLLDQIVSSEGGESVALELQAAEIERSIRVMRSLLRAIPNYNKKGETVVNLLDRIGQGFYSGIVATKFRDQIPLSFRVDHGHSPDVFQCIAKAVNIGALIHIPEKGTDQVLTSIVGERFRLNYLLAAYYKLPLSLDREISLTSLFEAGNQVEQGVLDV